MNQFYASISIIGTGSYGTALAIALARNGNVVLIWGHNPQTLKRLQIDRCNAIKLPNIYFCKNVIIAANLEQTINKSQDLLIAVPSHVFKDTLKKIQPYLNIHSRIVWATKGLENDTGRLLHEVAEEILGNNIPLAVISGPTFAKELAMGLPTAMTLASSDKKFIQDLQKKLYSSSNMRVYSHSDVVGVELGGVIKNIIAIAAGISDGIGFGANARTALITRGLKEMIRLGVALGAHPVTFIGMAGLGDLVLSCTDDQSRNRRFGLLLGKGNDVYKAKNMIAEVIEGFTNIKNVRLLAHRYNVEMPISEEVYQILCCKKSPREAAISLLRHCNKSENSLSELKLF